VNLKILDSRPNPSLAAALENFESQFHYPLGRDSWFRISHGDDYTCFFRAIGDARCFLATRDSEVVGVVTATICRLRRPGSRFERAGYISDLKVAPRARGRTLLGLLRAATDWVLTEPTPAFCVVMDGTGRDPTQYTGRVGVPAFKELAKLVVLRIPCDAFPTKAPSCIEKQAIDVVKSQYECLTAECFATDGGDATLRSGMTPIGLLHRDGNACGMVEDTRLGKRLFRHDGTEMISAHLSSFGYRSAQDAVDLIAAAAGHCGGLEIPAFFVAVGASDARDIVPRLPAGVVKAGATVFGYALNTQAAWSINSAEI
jgi:hypothetical protein